MSSWILFLVSIAAAGEPTSSDEAPRPAAGTVTPAGPPALLGSLPTEHIQVVLASSLAGIQTCYDEALGRRPDLVGESAFKLVVGKDGSAKASITKANRLGDRPMEDCVVAHLGTLRFDPVPGGGIEVVSYPLTFGAPE
jgi:hypothetical protein